MGCVPIFQTKLLLLKSPRGSFWFKIPPQKAVVILQTNRIFSSCLPRTEYGVYLIILLMVSAILTH